ncbi:MAG: amidohydrolase family protein [Thermoprotei archaeon]|nr:amidohydrolase family protein [Thermoprotei archaeon]
MGWGLDIVDFHVHLPLKPREAFEASQKLLEALSYAGVKAGVVINVEFGVKTFLENVSPDKIWRAASESLDYLMMSKIMYLHNIVFNPEKAIEEHVRILSEYSKDSESFAKAIIAAESGDKPLLIPVASYNPDAGVSENVEKLKSVGDKILGVKIFPTLHFTRPDEEKLKPLYEAIADIGGVVVVHTGCDPGIWEFLAFCSKARPSYVARAARNVKDAKFIVAHLGSYSALNPGIYFNEALEALSQDNVYADTSATDPYFVERAVEEIGHDKLLFGSDYPMVTGLEIDDAIEGILRLDITWKAKKAIMMENALKILRQWSGWRELNKIKKWETPS